MARASRPHPAWRGRLARIRRGTGILPVDGAKRRLPASLPSLWSGAGETPAPLQTPEHGRDAR
ncbi:MAG: hypothetical protein LBK99_17380, partial [Opitutaceae bacterium]|nr:hypothetical protein [Opitutaceae bacterium]